MRRLIAQLTRPVLLEAACAALRLPPLKSLARHVFFGRGSFPDTEPLSEKMEKAVMTKTFTGWTG
jgi:hypothetical protein